MGSKRYIFLFLSLSTLVEKSYTLDVVKTTTWPFFGKSENKVPPFQNFFYINNMYPNGLTQSPTSPTYNCEDNLNWYLIRNPKSGFVLEVNDANEVVLGVVTGYPKQLWKFIPTNTPGAYYVTNNLNGTMLDYIDTGNKYVTVDEKKHDSLNQQWILNHNGRIYNRGMMEILDIKDAKFVSGGHIQLCEDHSHEAQKFDLEQKK